MNTPIRLIITGQTAREIKADTRTLAYLEPRKLGWQEIRGMRQCAHGCKLHARRRGCVWEYALIHYGGYGCSLGRDKATAVVPAKVQVAA